MHDALQCLDDDDDDDDDHTMYTLPSIAFRTHIQLSALCSIFGLRHVSSHQSSGDRRCVSASLTNQNPRSFAELHVGRLAFVISHCRGLTASRIFD
jgi:hypothetical protein